MTPSLSRVFLLAALGCHGAPAASSADAGSSAAIDNHDGSFTFLSTFRVGAGAERYVCQDFANPFGGDAAIARFDSHLTPGAHHLLVFYAPLARDGAAADCDGGELAAGPYGSQRPDDTLVYPRGVAAAIPANTGLRLQAHYLNAAPTALDAVVELRVTLAPAGATRDRAAVLFFSNLSIAVPAHTHGVVVGKRCTLPFDVNLVQATGHMHRHGRGFTAATPSATLIQSSAWMDVAPAVFDPPLHLAAGTPIDFACTYDNDGGDALAYGPSAARDEMCIFSAQFYPAPFGGWSCL